MDPINLSDSIETGKTYSPLNDMEKDKVSESSGKSPINQIESEVNVKQEHSKTTSSSLEDVLPKDKVTELDQTQAPINLNVSVDIDPNKLVKLDNSAVSQTPQTVNNNSTKESSVNTINNDTLEKIKLLEVISENYTEIFKKESSDVLNEREKLSSVIDLQRESINSINVQSSINQKELRETSEKLAEASKNIENTSNINLSTLKEVNSPTTNNSSTSVNTSGSTINISDFVKKSEAVNNVNLEKSQNTTNISTFPTTKESTTNNQVEVVKAKELIPASVAPLSQKQTPQVVEKTKEPASSEITLTQVTEKVHEVARQKLEDENRRLTSEVKESSNINQEKAQPNVIIDMSEVANRLNRIERLLASPLEVKIVQ